MPSAASSKKRIFTTADRSVALLGGIIALTLYCCTLAPTITGEDSGEFVTAACTLGIAHPPGYPLYCILGWLFSHIPYASPAWRINFMSACFSAAAVSVLILTLIRLTKNRPIALASGLMLACTRELWSQSVIAEVYALSLFVLALATLLLLLWDEERNTQTLYLFAFLMGMGMTVHNTFLLVLPPAAVLFLLAEYKAEVRTSFPTLLKAAACAALPLLLYLYLPLRSRTNPMLDWGNPESFSLMLRHIFRSQYAFMVEQYPRSIPRFGGQVVVYLRFAREQAGWLPAVGGVIGLIMLMRQRLRFALFLLLSLILIPAGFIYWQNFEITREWLWIMRVFGIPAWYILALGTGICLHQLSQHSKTAQALALVLALTFVLFPLVRHYHYNDKSDYYWTENYARKLMDVLEPDALFISESDHASFSLLYMQAVLGERNDIDNIRRYGYLQTPLFDKLPSEMKERIGAYPPRRYDTELIAWLLDNTDRPLYLAQPRPLPSKNFQRYQACGPVFRALRKGEESQDCKDGSDWPLSDTTPTRDDYTAQAILYEAALNKAQTLLLGIKQDDAPVETVLNPALAWMEEALRHYGRDAAALNNIAVTLARHGFYTEAQGYFEEALELLPQSESIRNNLNRIHVKTR